MIAEFKTPVFDVHITDLADYLGLDSMTDPDYKVSKKKMLEWKMKIVNFNHALNGIEFSADSVRFSFSWSVYEEYLEEYDVMKLQTRFHLSLFDGCIMGNEIIEASKETGWKIDFDNFDLTRGEGYEKYIDEVEVSLTEKTILIR